MAIKLVIVDDAPFIREVLRHIFVGTEVEVVGEAQDGLEAVETVRSLRPQVVIMDIVIPSKSGIDAPLEIMKDLPNTRVIACSTVDQNAMVLRALDAGACNYLTKPFKAEEVLKAVRTAFKRDSKEAGV